MTPTYDNSPGGNLLITSCFIVLYIVHEPLHAAYQTVSLAPRKPIPKLFGPGKTASLGFPIVDAGMRELWHTGWMHNRVRMITASFLTKDLLDCRGRKGAAWFWDTLVDADLANNTMGWQWVAGCGADASPFFRIFNPVTQGIKFDPNGRLCSKMGAGTCRFAGPVDSSTMERSATLLMAKTNICSGRDVSSTQ